MSHAIQTTGEQTIISVSSWSYGLFEEKLADLNKKLAKWGLGAAVRLTREYRAHDLSEITGKDDDKGCIVYRWHMTVQVPVASAGIEGYTLIGKIEDLGNDQRLLSAIVADQSTLPVCPYKRDDHYEYATREEELAAQKWYFDTFLPAYTALKAENAAKLETLRTAKQTCEHCKTTRRRKAVLVFEKTDGSLAQIGTGCADEYFGVELLRALSGTWDLIERCGGVPKHFNPEQFREDFAMALHCVTRYGYVSRKVAESYTENSRFVPAGTPAHCKTSTTDMVHEIRNHVGSFWSMLTPEDITLLAGKDVAAIATRNSELQGKVTSTLTSPEETPEQKEARHYAQVFTEVHVLALETIKNENVPVGFSHYALAYFFAKTTKPENFARAYAEAMNFWAELVPETTDQFTTNVKAIALAEANKSVAMTSMVALKWLEATRSIEKPGFFVPAHRTQFPKDPANTYLGTEGAMVNVELTVTMKRHGGGDYDEPWFMLKGRTAENVSVSFFCKRTMFMNVQEGESLKVRGKVKKHETYKDQKNTVLYFVKEA